MNRRQGRQRCRVRMWRVTALMISFLEGPRMTQTLPRNLFLDVPDYSFHTRFSPSRRFCLPPVRRRSTPAPAPPMKPQHPGRYRRNPPGRPYACETDSWFREGKNGAPREIRTRDLLVRRETALLAFPCATCRCDAGAPEGNACAQIDGRRAGVAVPYPPGCRGVRA